MNNQLIDPCQPVDEWIDFYTRKRCESYVLKMQRRLDKAVRINDIDRIRHITYLLSKRSKAVKILAIERVTRTNSGKHTPGIDGIFTPTERIEADRFRCHLLKTVNVSQSPSPIRRVEIPKANGKKRPLGIPTIKDRVIQAILAITIEPIAEYHFLDCSYGFRPRRSAHDAIEHIFRKLANTNRPGWIIEGDIESCFDEISHHGIIEKMVSWKIPQSIRWSVSRLLKTGVLINGVKYQPTAGTPQGGILSPMLANIALTTLDEWGQSCQGVNPIVRYADDFIVVAQTKEEAEQKKNEIASILSEKIGLSLSPSKTRITHINDGINFLGFNIRKYRHRSPKSRFHHVGKLLIKPQKEKVTRFIADCGQLISDYRGRNLQQLLRVLNPKLMGFANYYRFVVSKRSYQNISHQIWWKVYRWLRKSHPKKSAKWVMIKYLTQYDAFHQTKTFSMNGVKLYRPQFMPITRFRKVKSGIRVYDNNKTARDYWKQRTYQNGLCSIYSVKVEKLFKRQVGFCPVCRQPISGTQIRQGRIQIHHLFPQSKTNTHKLANLRLIHQECHRELHRILSLSEMFSFAHSGIDYCAKDFLFGTFV